MEYTGINRYWIDEFGNVFNMKTGRYLARKFNKQNGYYSVALSDGIKVHTIYVHRLVGKTFNGDSYFDGADINHLDGNKGNNYYKNLKWCTRKENINHSFQLGLSNTKGQRNSQSILTTIQVKVIKEAILNGLKRREIATYFKVHPDTIRSIQNNKNWSHV